MQNQKQTSLPILHFSFFILKFSILGEQFNRQSAGQIISCDGPGMRVVLLTIDH
jgi:hypothetical protein